MFILVLSIGISCNKPDPSKNTDSETTKDKLMVSSPITVVDYHNNINSSYKILKKNNKWIVDKGEFGTLHNLTVDLKNGYINIEIEMGDGPYVSQTALFKSKTNKKIVCFVTTSGSGLYGSDEIILYEFKNSRMKEITSTILPEVSIDDVVSGQFNKKTLEAIRKINKSKTSVIWKYYKLPRYGTNIILSIGPGFPGSFKDQITEKELIMIEQLEKAIKQKILFNFNTNTGKFEVSKISKK